MGTAGSRTSGEKRFDFLLMTSSFQKLEHPQVSGRFTMRQPHDEATRSHQELAGVSEIPQASELDDKNSAVLPDGKVVKSTESRKVAEATAKSFHGATVQEIKQTVEQPSFDITPAMSEKVSAGVPLFIRSRDWGDFPDVVISASLGEASKHPDYAAAKAGDFEAAGRLVDSVLTTQSVDRLETLLNGRQATLVPVHAEEASGRNKIPVAAAVLLGDRLGLPTEDDITQVSKVSRTGSNGLQRLARQPGFTGTVETGKNYVLVDDTLTQGGTFAQLKEYIEQNGGKVLGAFALTGKQYSAKVNPNADTIAQLRKDYSAIEPWWKSEFGYGFDGLTESEARYISKLNLSPDTLRDRIAAARSEGGYSSAEGATGTAADGTGKVVSGVGLRNP